MNYELTNQAVMKILVHKLGGVRLRLSRTYTI